MRKAPFESIVISGPRMCDSWITGWGKEVMRGERWKEVMLVREARQRDSPQSLFSQTRSDALLRGVSKLAVMGAAFLALDLLGMWLSGFKIQCLTQECGLVNQGLTSATPLVIKPNHRGHSTQLCACLRGHLPHSSVPSCVVILPHSSAPACVVTLHGALCHPAMVSVSGRLAGIISE